MQSSLKKYRSSYFQDIATAMQSMHAQIIIVTHILPDRPELLEAIEKIAPISLLVAIPYSIEEETFKRLQSKYTTLSPSLDELMNEEYLYQETIKRINLNIPLIILEIGGYYAPILHRLKEILGNNLLGVVEDTETGHRQYIKLSNLPCPVISVARSSLKETEDFLVGTSCLFSTENLLRQAGFLIECKQALILGFGKVGRGLAHALRRRGCHVSVYDTNPIRRILALSEGFLIPEKFEALSSADLVFGATGNYSLSNGDFEKLRPGALLISCSSKQIEFNLEYLLANYQKENLLDNYAAFYQKYAKDSHYFYLLAEGEPVNFLDGAVIGPVLALVQAEILFAINELFELKGKHGIFNVKEEDRKMLAQKWLSYFCNPQLGNYLNG